MEAVVFLTIDDAIGNRYTLNVPYNKAGSNATNGDALNVIDALELVTASKVVKYGRGQERLRTANLPSTDSVLINLCLNTITTSGIENKIIIPGVDPNLIDFLAGDLVDFSTVRMTDFKNRVENFFLDETTYEEFTIAGAFITGQET